MFNIKKFQHKLINYKQFIKFNYLKKISIKYINFKPYKNKLFFSNKSVVQPKSTPKATLQA